LRSDHREALGEWADCCHDRITFECSHFRERTVWQSHRASDALSPPGTSLADYTVLVPADAVVTLRSSDGALRAQGLSGDVTLEAATALVEVTDISDAHLHVKSLSGFVTLTNVRNSHLDVRSLSGDVKIHNVRESFLEAHSGSGRTSYDGDPGKSGDYRLTSHSGDLEVSIPASALVEIRVHSLKGESDQGLPRAGSVPPAGQRSLLLKAGIVNASRFVLRSFRGGINVKRP
jgi:Putative adhesin